MNKHVPNIITLSRIGLSIFLFFITGNKALFFAVYIIAGVTDVFDGHIARKYHLETVVGANLDSLADFLFLISSLLRMVLSYGLVSAMEETAILIVSDRYNPNIKSLLHIRPVMRNLYTVKGVSENG